jgi:hypothetical protein
MKKILVIGLVVLFFILPTFACAVNAESNTGEIKINQSISDGNQTVLVIQINVGGRRIVVGIMNNGSSTANANDIFIKMTVMGGFFGNINRSEAWGVVYIPVRSVAAMSATHFFGLGKITIVVVARALNAPDVSKTVTAFIIGPFIHM